MRRLSLALVLALACHASRADAGAIAGTVLYAYHNTTGINPGAAYLIADEGILARGELTSADILAFAFNGMTRQNLEPVDIPISTTTGLPLEESVFTASIEFGPGFVTEVDAVIGADGSGRWRVATTGARELSGSGYWTVETAIAPEPSSIVMGLMATTAGAICVRLHRPVTGPSRP